MGDALDKIRDASARRHLAEIRQLEGDVVLSSDLQTLVPGFRVFRGIYKPAGSDYALWIRQTRRGVYSDKDPVIHPDGSWTYLYAPESQEGKFDKGLATNRSLLKCMTDRVPVGVFRQTADVDGKVAYRVHGLGYVEGFDGRYFTVRGEPIIEDLTPIPEGIVPPFVGFDPSPLPVQSALRKIRERRFGSLIRELYHQKCSLCSVGYQLRGRTLAVEAAHVIPLSANGVVGDVRNGVLLCSNHHTLFDAFAWTFDKDYHVVVTVEREFRQSALANHVLGWEGRRLPNLPDLTENYPAKDAIAWRLEEFNRHQ